MKSGKDPRQFFNRSSIDDALICGICFSVLNGPTTLLCTHTFCKQCVIDWEKRAPNASRTFQCPHCRETMPVGSGIQNRIAEAWIDTLEAPCTFGGCFWKGRYGDMSTHLKTCLANPANAKTDEARQELEKAQKKYLASLDQDSDYEDDGRRAGLPFSARLALRKQERAAQQVEAPVSNIRREMQKLKEDAARLAVPPIVVSAATTKDESGDFDDGYGSVTEDDDDVLAALNRRLDQIKGVPTSGKPVKNKSNPAAPKAKSKAKSRATRASKNSQSESEAPVGRGLKRVKPLVDFDSDSDGVLPQVSNSDDDDSDVICLSD